MNSIFKLIVIIAVLLGSISQNQLVGQTPDPENDGWQTEAISDSTQKLLQKMVAEKLGLEPADNKGVPPLAAGAQCALLDEDLFALKREDALVSCRQLKPDVLPLLAGEEFSVGFSRLLKPLLENSATGIRFRLKTTRVTLSADKVQTRALLFATSMTDRGSLQLNSTWQVNWTLPANQAPPQLKSIDILAHDETYLLSSKPWFTDATAALFNGDSAFESQVVLGMPDWLNRVERFAGLSIYSRHGIAVGDANGDGLDDIYLCQPGGLPNRLFYQQPDGTVADHSAASQVDWLDDTRSALFVDLDNDGNQDLVLGTFVGLYVCRNLGDGVFERAIKLPKVDKDISSLSAVDYDNDGYLDIHVCTYNSEDQINGRDHQNVYDLNARGGVNRLFRNLIGESKGQSNSKWAFKDITDESGLQAGNARFSLAAAWEDFDNDGDQDLYIANDFGLNSLYRNDAGKFKEVSAELGVQDYGPGMSVAWGDFNRDGYPDLYVANMFSAAGNRVTRQEQFKSAAQGTSRESFQRFNKGNSLYTFNGEKFEEIPNAAGAENALWAWSSLLADIDNDGWQDALVANGYITGPGGGDL